MTNYEKIKNMSKEELARWIMEHDYNSIQDEFCPKLCPFSENGEDCHHEECVYNTDNTVLDYLESEDTSCN